MAESTQTTEATGITKLAASSDMPQVKAAIDQIAQYLQLLELIENDDFCVIISPEGVKVGDAQFKRFSVNILNRGSGKEHFGAMLKPAVDLIESSVKYNKRVVAAHLHLTTPAGDKIK